MQTSTSVERAGQGRSDMPAVLPFSVHLSTGWL